MALTILAELYYLTSIIVSVGFLRSIYNLFTISHKYEILLITTSQKRILRLWYFIKNFFLYFFTYVYLLYVVNSFKDFSFPIIDFLMYFFILFLYVHLSTPIFKDSLYLQQCLNKKNKKYFFIFILSLLLTLLSYFLELFFNYKEISILELVLILGFYSKHIDRKTIILNNQHLKIKSPFVLFCLSPLYIKILIIFCNNPFFNIREVFNTGEVELSHIASYLYNSKNIIIIFITISLLSLLWASYVVSNTFNFTSFLSYKNRQWEITYITIDKYAICSFNDCTFMIKIDTIKDNYFCVLNGNSYYFLEKETIKDFQII